ncbi:hypothetical protein SUGI_0728620 [Cryptomeria japonica]|nr:hypothetical protein SUGI_0728540 [Cryptomeria japonica]GLJ36292.1 hypothetical protein SUGI_0728620 [Cryptomeria japonica]
MDTEYKDFNNFYQRLKKLLNEKKIDLMFDVVWIPIVIEGRGTRAIHAEWDEKIEWLSTTDPWSINPMLMRYFRRHTSFHKLPVLVAVSPDGTFHSDNFVVNTAMDEAGVNIKVVTEEEKKMIREQVQSVRMKKGI